MFPDCKRQAGRELTAGLSRFTEFIVNIRQEAADGPVEHASVTDVFSCLLENYASYGDVEELSKEFEKLSRTIKSERLKHHCLEAVVSVRNPFVPGMALSVALAEAAERALEGERKKLSSLQEGVDTLLLEVLERLPQTTRGFENGLFGCAAVFEPASANGIEGIVGPLSLALGRRQQTQTFCTAPLVVDYISRTFTRGLPILWDSKGTLRHSQERDPSGFAQPLPDGLKAERFIAADETLRRSASLKFLADAEDRDESLAVGRDGFFGEILQGSPTLRAGETLVAFGFSVLGAALLLWAEFGKSSIIGWVAGIASFIFLLFSKFFYLVGVTLALETIFPGVQFITAGLVSKPKSYYIVPAMRMVLDCVVYLGMLAFFNALVLFHEDGPLAWGEKLFAVHLMVSLHLCKVRENGK